MYSIDRKQIDEQLTEILITKHTEDKRIPVALHYIIQLSDDFEYRQETQARVIRRSIEINRDK